MDNKQIINGLLILGVAYFMFGQGGQAPPADGGGTIIVDNNIGDAATVTTNVYDAQANSQTEIAVTLYAYLTSGVKLVNGVASTTDISTAVVGDTLLLSGGDATYYMDEKTGVSVSKGTQVVDMVGHTAAAETSLAVTGYDSDMNTLTAGGVAQCDYNVTLGADADKTYYFKLANQDADSLFRGGAICTFSYNSTSAEDFTVIDSRFEKATLPKQMDDSGITVYRSDGGGTTTKTGYDYCYKFKEKMYDLSEWQEITVKTLFESGSTDPVNGNSGFGLLFVDAGYAQSLSGESIFDFYRHDDNERVTEVGISDTRTDPEGLTSGAIVCVE